MSDKEGLLKEIIKENQSSQGHNTRNPPISQGVKFMITIGVLAVIAATYVYLDWGILQILGVAFVLLTVATIDENGPAWRRGLFVALTFSILVLGHFVVDDNLMSWGALILASVLFFICITFISEIFKFKPGDGSVLTAYVLGLIIIFPIAIFFLYQGMTGLGY